MFEKVFDFFKSSQGRGLIILILGNVVLPLLKGEKVENENGGKAVQDCGGNCQE